MKAPKIASEYVTEAIVVIAKYEYPDSWPNLPAEIMNFLTDGNHEVNLKVWKIIKNVTKRYGFEERSDPLWKEVNLMIADVHDKLLYYAQGYLNHLKSPENNDLMETFLLNYKTILQIFYNLNFQELSGPVEDNLVNWTLILRETLSQKIGLISGSLSHTENIWFQCKGEAIKSALLFATKYTDDFMPMIQPFAEEIWLICSESNQDEKYTQTLVNSMKYFRSFSENQNFREFFAQNLSQMFHKVVIPNLYMNGNPLITPEYTLAAFEEDPRSFSESLLSNKEFGERAEYCTTFLKSLTKFHNENVASVLMELLSDVFKMFQENSGNIDVKVEIVALNLVCFTAPSGMRADHGVVEICMNQDLVTTTYEYLVKPRLGPVFEAVLKNQVLEDFNCFRI